MQIFKCPNCKSGRTRYLKYVVKNIDDIHEVRFCLICGLEFDIDEKTAETERSVVEEILHDEDKGLG